MKSAFHLFSCFKKAARVCKVPGTKGASVFKSALLANSLSQNCTEGF